MTLRQADAVMRAGVPVIYDGMQFLRIISVSRVLTRHNTVEPSVALEDRYAHTVYHARPEAVTIHGEIEGRRYWFDGENLKSERIEE